MLGSHSPLAGKARKLLHLTTGWARELERGKAGWGPGWVARVLPCWFGAWA